jgi:cell division protein FtsW (lipid II flippase)
MGLTYTAALERTTRRQTTSARRLGKHQVMLAATTFAVSLAVALAYVGRLEADALRDGQRPTVVDLSSVSTSNDLEPVFDPLFANASDRQFAAARLLEFVVAIRETGNDLTNVGAISRATVAVEAIQRTPALVAYKERVREALERSAAISAPPPDVLPLLTSTDIAMIKPSLVVRDSQEFTRQAAMWSAVYLTSFWLVAFCWWWRGSRGDYPLLAATYLLTGIGLAALLSRPDPLRDTLLFVRYTQGICLGLAAFCVVSLVDVRRIASLTLSYVPLAGALLLSLVLILFGWGPGGSGVKVNLGSVQPIEAIRLLLALFLAGYFARRWELLRQIQTRGLNRIRLPRALERPRLQYVLPVLAGVGAALLFFFLQKDLGPALILSCLFLATYAVARNRIGMAIVGVAILVAGFYAGYRLNLSSTLVARVEMWRSPWDNTVRGGDQVAQAVWALSTGGFSGTGLGLGDTRYLPAGHTDLVLAAIGEELGFLGLLCVAGAFAIIAVRGVRSALTATHEYGFFAGVTITLFLILPVLIMAAGILGLVPLTGVVTPFLSYGGSAMVTNFAALGLLSAIGNARSSVVTMQAFQLPTRHLAVSLASLGLALVATLAGVQVLYADTYTMKPHLGRQADGVRRYQYNQRALDLLDGVPRGSVYDRRGRPLATSDAAVARKARVEYAKLGVAVDAGCREPLGIRCYPLGGAAFHILGDVRSRRNWAATNTSYVERDAQDRLRGFDDHESTVLTRDESGAAVPIIRRDYRELLPLLRHRYSPEHPDVQAFLNRTRDITLTIDAAFQARVTKIVSKYAAQSAKGRAAAVVLDPETGDLLAIASYPFPDAGDRHEIDDGTLLDRARYGLYPPGSTFKLVTAAAVFRQRSSLDRASFRCDRLPDGRVGARIPGRGAVRDDVQITHPHGAIGLSDALARSCNAYFAQLAVRLGPEALLETAAAAGISVTPSNRASGLRPSLAQAGYGQGEVVATPLRMARVAAAIASDGELREPRMERRAEKAAQRELLLPPDSAAVLRRSLRDAVLNGTGRGLRNHPWRIAGKTGTAEVRGARSHSWFVGFAPHGGAEKRIAFAVIVEHAGYGSVAAAPAAGEIVSAAAESGLIR